MSSTRDRRNKAEHTSEVAFGIIDAEAAARDAKTAKLRKMREAQAADAAPEPADGKPAPRKRAITRKPRKVGP